MRDYNVIKNHSFLSRTSLLPIMTSLLFFVFLISCNTDTTSKGTVVLSDSTTTNALENKTIVAETKKDYVLVKVDHLRVRDKPSTEGSNVVASLAENTYWKYTGKESDQKEKIEIRGQEFDTYWYLIDVGNCVSGWVYGGAIEFVEKPEIITNTAPIIFFEPELVKEYGKERIELVTQKITAFDAIKSAAELLDYYNTATEIILENLPELDTKVYEGQFEVSRLGCALKIFFFDQLCSECAVELYINSADFLAKAKETPNKIDDEIFQLVADAVGPYNSFDVGHLSQRDCDFCWHSILGDGQILSYWKRVAKIRTWQLDHLSEVKMGLIMRQMADYLLLEMESDTYVYSQEKVLAEYDEIIKVLKKVDWQKARDIAFANGQLRAKIKKGDGLTFDCENKDCSNQ